LTGRLYLECDPSAAKDARDWLAQELAGWSDPLLDDAVLVVSELVTNAVLHAQTEVEVVAHVATSTARVEVIDGSPARPMPRHYSSDATTGRGLHLLHALTTRWGTEISAHAKSVWFEIDNTLAKEQRNCGANDLQLPDLSSWPDLDDFDTATDTVARLPGTSTVEVRILHLPLEVYLSAQEHSDALLREFALLAGYAPPDEVPRRLVDLAVEVRGQFGPASTALSETIEAAIQRGDRTVDLTLALPPEASHALLRLAEHLDEADRFCDAGNLLTFSSSSVVREFRAWYTAEILSQLDGGSPHSWPSPIHP
jgi:hypothetical protein